jgi:cytosine/adenosine deaminase-related metal-dependent hydrolase
VLFHELIGFREADPVGRATSAAARAAAAVATAGPAGRPAMDASVVAHAPYSVSPRLVQAIAALPGAAPRSIHLAESAEEVEFLQTGRGPMRELLEAIGAWTDEWRVPSTDPVDYVASTGYLRPGTLVVHAVHLADSALARLREAGAIIVTCPRSNAWVGSIPPPVDRFYAAGLPVAVGTDSLASARTLSVWDELAELRRLAPGVPARTLLESATRRGAEALGRAADFGAIAPGRRAVFAVAAVQPDVTDVEECLVTGVELSRVSRLDLV